MAAGPKSPYVFVSEYHTHSRWSANGYICVVYSPLGPHLLQQDKEELTRPLPVLASLQKRLPFRSWPAARCATQSQWERNAGLQNPLSHLRPRLRIRRPVFLHHLLMELSRDVRERESLMADEIAHIVASSSMALTVNHDSGVVKVNVPRSFKEPNSRGGIIEHNSGAQHLRLLRVDCLHIFGRARVSRTYE